MTGEAQADEERVLIPTKQGQRDLETIRPGLEAWLRTHLAGGPALRITGIRLPTGAGVANETLIVDATGVDKDAGEAGYVVRVGAADDHLYLDMDLRAHYRIYDVLSREPHIPSPPLVGFEPDHALFGQPFFVMERVEGLVPSDNPSFYESGWVADLGEDERRRMWRNSVEVMARLHRLEPRKFSFLERPRLGATGIEQELRFWLRYAQWCGADRYPIVGKASAWLLNNLPADAPPGFSWGDARPPNIIYQGVECAAVLDWDTASLCGGENDLAWWTLMNQSGARARGEGRFAGWGAARETWALWEDLVGRRAAYLDWHLVFNSFRLRLIMTRLPAILHKAGAITAEQQAAIADNGEMEAVSALLDKPLAGRYDSAWPGWDE